MQNYRKIQTERSKKRKNTTRNDKSKSQSVHTFQSHSHPPCAVFLERFRQVAAAGPKEDQDVLRSIVRHKPAIPQSIISELTGPSGRSKALCEEFIDSRADLSR